MTKPQRKFLQWIFEKWVMLPVRHNFLNLFRYGDGRYSEKSIRHQFSRKMNFMGWFDSAFGCLKNKECIAAFDPSYIPKSGKKTYGKGHFLSGKNQRAKPGLRSDVWHWLTWQMRQLIVWKPFKHQPIEKKN